MNLKKIDEAVAAIRQRRVRSKYNAVRTWCCYSCLVPYPRITSRANGARDCLVCGSHDSIVCFASKAELKHWHVLRLREKAGEISNLQYQPSYHLSIKGNYVGKYTADAEYIEGCIGVIVEVKGKRLADGEFRRKVAEALYGITVTVVEV